MVEKEQKIKQLLEKDLPMLRSAANSILNNLADADDAVQIALVKVWKHLDNFVTNAKLSTWAYTITVNTAKDIYRKKVREQKKAKQFDHTLNQTNSDYEIMLEKLRGAIAELPQDLCTVITLVSLNGMRPDEAAEKLNCSTETIYQRIHKAKKILRKKLGVK